MELEGVREAARGNKGMQFTALLHHITPQLLAHSFYAVYRVAAVGLDSMYWREYGAVWPWRCDRCALRGRQRHGFQDAMAGSAVSDAITGTLSQVGFIPQ